MTNSISVLLAGAALTAVTLAGCATYGSLQRQQRPVYAFASDELPMSIAVVPRDADAGKAPKARQQNGNDKAEPEPELINLYKAERPYRNRDGANIPARCLALSGGGQRAAAYAIGVMRALSEHEELDKFDIISAVSGGAYAAAWYYTQWFYEPEQASSRFLFEEKRLSPFDAYSLGAQVIGDVYYGVTIIPVTLYNLGISPLFEALTPYPPGSLGPYRTVYARRIHNYLGKDLTLGQLATFVKGRGLPMPIFNLTIQDRETDALRVHGQIYEVTPFHRGSDYLGYREVIEGPSLSAVVVSSGSATDKPPDWRFLRQLRIRSGSILGQTIWAPRKKDESWWSSVVTRKFLFLSDGGHSENLGAFSAIRRGCQHLTIVDAEEELNRNYLFEAYNRHYRFEAYSVLKTLVRVELNAEISIPSIDNYLGPLVDEPKNTSIKTTWEEVSMKGKITSLAKPPEGNDTSPAGVPVRYLKLAFDFCTLPEKVKQEIKLPKCPVVSQNIQGSQYYSPKLIAVAAKDKGIFPMYPTTNQWLSADQQHALADLGYAHMKATLCAEGKCETIRAPNETATERRN